MAETDSYLLGHHNYLKKSFAACKKQWQFLLLNHMGHLFVIFLYL
jgi:hypothetical protein